MNNKTGLSLVSMHTPDEVKKFLEIYREETGRYPGFELSYRMDSHFIENTVFIRGNVLSGHAPCPGKYLPNLGSRETEVIRESLDSIRKSADTVASFGGKFLVLHAGYTLDSPVFTEYIERKKFLKNMKSRTVICGIRKVPSVNAGMVILKNIKFLWKKPLRILKQPQTSARIEE